MNCTVCIVSPGQEKEYQVALASWKKFMPKWEHVKVSTESDMVQGLKDDYKNGDFLSVIRPVIVSQFLEQYDKVLFLTPDVVFFNEPEEFINNDYSEAVVVPHVITGIPYEGKEPNLKTISSNGHINSNIVLWSNSQKIKNFLSWQTGVLKNFTTTEQLTLNCLPVFVDDVKILRDPGYNFGYFNAQERGVKLQDGAWFVNGWQPLVCAQFSGFIPGHLTGDTLTLFNWYEQELRK